MAFLRRCWLVGPPLSVPVLYALALESLARALELAPLEQIRLGIAGLPIVAIAFGWAMRWSCPESADPSPVLAKVRELFGDFSPFRLKLSVWENLHRVNAVSVGGIWTGATIVVTRGLLNELPAAGQRMLLLHEVAHQTRHHAWLRQLALLGLVIPFLQTWTLREPGSLSVWLASQVALLAWSYFALVTINRCLEKDADLTALRYAARLGWSSRLAAAALGRAIIQASPGPRDRANWSHPSVPERTRLLRVVGDRDSLEGVLNQPLTHVAWVLFVIGVIAIVSVGGAL